MKRLLVALALLCFASVPAMAQEPTGFIYQNTTHPLMGSGSVTTPKVGIATCKSYFGFVSLGDCSIKTAMRNGEINNLSHVDQHIKNILGWTKIEVRAYGN